MAAALLTALLIAAERRSAEPVLSPHIFHNRVFVIATAVMGLSFMGIFGAFVFLPLFFQLCSAWRRQSRPYAGADDGRHDPDVLLEGWCRGPKVQIYPSPAWLRQLSFLR
jgi:hypothetical protein